MTHSARTRLLAWRRWSLRGRLIAIAALGVLVPILVLAGWTTQRLKRSGEELLRSQLDASLSAVERSIERSWERHRGNLSLLADNDVVRAGLRVPQRQLATPETRFLADAFQIVAPVVDEVVFSDARGIARWRIAPDPGLQPRVEALPSSAQRPSSRLGSVAIEIPLTDTGSGPALGSMTALLRVSAVVEAPAVIGGPGASLKVLDSRGAVALLVWGAPGDSTPGADGKAAAHSRMVVERRLISPPLRLVATAPTDPYVAPIERSGRVGMLVLFGILVATFAVAAGLTERATRSLQLLAAGADAVARGNLDHQVEVESADEIGRVAAAFNSMTRDLRRTLREGAQRNALAAVGEFAAELAHEVRNPLTSVRLDLQRLHERLPSDPKLREPLLRALTVLDRLNRTVTGALRVARSGTISHEPLQLGSALEPAFQTAVPAFATRDIVLRREIGDAARVWLRGDADALAQLFTNILLNAAEAIKRDGHVEVSAAQQIGSVTVMIADSGPGIAPAIMRQLEGSFHTTKPGGTGLGLTIARRIATAHGGQIEFDSTLGVGTVVRVTLPQEAAVQDRHEGGA